MKRVMLGTLVILGVLAAGVWADPVVQDSDEKCAKSTNWLINPRCREYKEKQGVDAVCKALKYKSSYQGQDCAKLRPGPEAQATMQMPAGADCDGKDQFNEACTHYRWTKTCKKQKYQGKAGAWDCQKVKEARSKVCEGSRFGGPNEQDQDCFMLNNEKIHSPLKGNPAPPADAADRVGQSGAIEQPKGQKQDPKEALKNLAQTNAEGGPGKETPPAKPGDPKPNSAPNTENAEQAKKLSDDKFENPAPPGQETKPVPTGITKPEPQGPGTTPSGKPEPVKEPETIKVAAGVNVKEETKGGKKPWYAYSGLWAGLGAASAAPVTAVVFHYAAGAAATTSIGLGLGLGAGIIIAWALAEFYAKESNPMFYVWPGILGTGLGAFGLLMPGGGWLLGMIGMALGVGIGLVPAIQAGREKSAKEKAKKAAEAQAEEEE